MKGFTKKVNGSKPVPNMRYTLSSVKIKQREEEDKMIHRLAKEVAQEYLKSEAEVKSL